MKKPNSSIERKLQFATHPYAEIFKQLKTGGHKMARDIHRTREAKLCREVQVIREELCRTLNSANPATPEIRHICILANAIQNTMSQLDETRILFHSKGLWKIRKSANDLLEKAKAEYRKAIKRNQQGGLPMKK